MFICFLIMNNFIFSPYMAEDGSKKQECKCKDIYKYVNVNINTSSQVSLFTPHAAQARVKVPK
jgi:hypothetical protein